MAKAVIRAGASFDTLTQPELHTSLQNMVVSWRKEMTRGDRYRRFSRNGTVASDGTLSIGGSDSSIEGFGPAEGIVWAVLRIAVIGAGPSPALNLYVNSADASAAVREALPTYLNFGSNEFVLAPGDTLLVTGTALTPATVVTVTGQARELPQSMEWRLGG